MFGLQIELDRLVAESGRLREQFRQDAGKVERSDWANLKHSLRGWIESRLPANLPGLERDYQGLESQFTAELRKADALEADRFSARAGYVSLVKLSRPAEYPEALLVEAGLRSHAAATPRYTSIALRQTRGAVYWKPMDLTIGGAKLRRPASPSRTHLAGASFSHPGSASSARLFGTCLITVYFAFLPMATSPRPFFRKVTVRTAFSASIQPLCSRRILSMNG